MDMKREFEQMLRDAIANGRDELADTVPQLADAMAQAAGRLSRSVGTAGFHRALIAERDALAMLGGISVTRAAGAWDVELRGILLGALRVAAVVLSAA